MDNILEFISQNKEWIFSGIGVALITIFVPIFFKKNKKKKNRPIIVKNYNNNVNNNSQNNTNSQNNNKIKNNPIQVPKIELTKIRLYSTGSKGKVYTDKFIKSINHNFGIEITLKNNTSATQNVKVGWCIYNKEGNELIKGTFNKKVNQKSSLTTDFYVKENSFNNLKPGKYKSQFWVNDKRVQKAYFNITYK